MAAVDLNSDLGESYGAWSIGDDQAMLQVVTSANIACGFHGGDPPTLRRVCTWAADAGVRIGAQVSYPDLQGFGRRAMAVDPAELQDMVLYQLGALDAFAQVAGTEIAYVKPHGALYHAAASDQSVARAVVGATAEYDPSCAVLGPGGSALLEAADAAGLESVAEGFADRGYLPDGTLVPRGADGAVLHDVTEVAARAVRMVHDQAVIAIDGTRVPLPVRSLCVHGDTPGAVAMARAIRSALTAAGIGVHPFT